MHNYIYSIFPFLSFYFLFSSIYAYVHAYVYILNNIYQHILIDLRKKRKGEILFKVKKCYLYFLILRTIVI